MTANTKKNKAVERIKNNDNLKAKFIKPSGFSVFLIVLSILILYLQVILWIGEGSLAEVWRLNKSISIVKQENKKLEARNQKLIDEVEALRNGLDLIEHKAREDLGLVKKDEVFFHVIDRRTEEEKSTKPKLPNL